MFTFVYDEGSSGNTGSGRISKTSFFRIIVCSCHSLSSTDDVSEAGLSRRTARVPALG